MKFSDFRSNSHPYKRNFPSAEARCDLLETIISEFKKEISFTVFYSAICDADFYRERRSDSRITDRLGHPYLAAAYRVLSRVEFENRTMKNNKGNTFVVWDQQIYQEKLEALIADPLHLTRFTQIIDTAYFGNSHHSKLIQIADLLAGIPRYHCVCEHTRKPKKYFDERIAALVPTILQAAVARECFTEGLQEFYSHIEKSPDRSGL